MLRVPPLCETAVVQGEEEHRPPPGTVLSVRKEGNTPPCMKPLLIRLTVPVHRTSTEEARRYAMGGGGLGGGGDGGGLGDGGGGEGEGGGGLGEGGLGATSCRRAMVGGPMLSRVTPGRSIS